MIWLLIGYMFLFIHRPFEYWPVLGSIRLELLYMLLTGAVWLAYPHKRLTFNYTHIAIATFALAVVACTLISPWSDDGWPVVENYFKILVFYLLVVTSVRDEKDLKRLVLGLVMAMAFYMAHSLWEFRNGRFVYRMKIVRLIGVDVTNSDPNAFAATIVLSLVFVPVLWRFYGTWLRSFLAGYLGLAIVCIGLTGSRGGFVSLGLWGLVTILRSRRRLGLLLGALLAVPVMWSALPDRLQNRFETIIDPSVGPANAQGSAEGRIVGLLTGLELWQKNPLFGVGPGAWMSATGRDLKAHNLIGQLLGEMGSLGGLTFVALLLSLLANIFWIRRACRSAEGDQFPFALAGSIGLGICILLFEGNFGHNLFRYNWVWFSAFLVAARQLVLSQEWGHDVDWNSQRPEEEGGWPLEEPIVDSLEVMEAT